MKPERDTSRPDGTLPEPYEPVEVEPVVRAFPALVSHLMPPYAALPDTGADIDGDWIRLAADWFLRGVDEQSKFLAKPGIDPAMAFWHLATIMGSYEPKHQVKMASVAFLASRWFDAVTLGTTGQTYGTVPTDAEELMTPLGAEQAD